MSKGDFIAVHQQIEGLRQVMFKLAERIDDLAAQMQYVRKQLNAHNIALAAAKRARPSDTAATETVE